MDKLNFSVVINAPKEKVWQKMLEHETYRQWTEPFHTGSDYVGDWNQGSKILFVAPGEDGKIGGMISRIKENRPYEYLAIEHLGVIQDGKEDYSGDVENWSGAEETYTFKGVNGKTELIVRMDINDEFKEMFEGMWPKALQKLKEISEK
jgi:uncharacterized protein YndB with AHSA1/START domain